MTAKKISKFLALGIMLAFFAICAFLTGTIAVATYLFGFEKESVDSFLFVIGIINSSALFLIIVILVILAVLQIREGKRLKQEGLRGLWSTLCGVGDVFFAISLLSILIGDLYSQSFFMIFGRLNFYVSFMNSLNLVLDAILFVFCIAAGVMYLVSAITQKRMGKLNPLLLVSGIVLLAYALVLGGMYLTIAFMSVEIYRFLVTILSIMMLAARSFRGLAPLTYPQFSQAQLVQPPSAPQAPYEPEQPLRQ